MLDKTSPPRDTASALVLALWPQSAGRNRLYEPYGDALPPHLQDEPIAPPQITLLTSDGQPIARSGAVVDEPVQVAELPDHVVNAFLVIEDRRFYTHWGVDPRGLARTAWSKRNR